MAAQGYVLRLPWWHTLGRKDPDFLASLGTEPPGDGVEAERKGKRRPLCRRMEEGSWTHLQSTLRQLSLHLVQIRDTYSTTETVT